MILLLISKLILLSLPTTFSPCLLLFRKYFLTFFPTLICVSQTLATISSLLKFEHSRLIKDISVKVYKGLPATYYCLPPE